MRVPWEKIPWDKSGNIAQIAVALLALAAFILTAYQSRKTAELLAHARDAFVAQSLPIVKFDAYQWLQGPQGLDCSNPERELLTYFRNFSGVPVILEDSNLNIKMGNRPVFPHPPEIEETSLIK